MTTIELERRPLLVPVSWARNGNLNGYAKVLSPGTADYEVAYIRCVRAFRERGIPMPYAPFVAVP